MHNKSFYAHPAALVDTEEIGQGTRVWAFAHVMKGARIGSECNIGEGCFIESDVVLGDSVVLKNGVALWTGVRLEDRVFVGPNAVFTNDLIPRAKVFKPVVPTIVREGASIGANATIVCGNEIGRFAVVGAGAVVTRTVPDYGLVYGNPARLHGYVCRCGTSIALQGDNARCDCGMEFRMDGKSLVEAGECRARAGVK